MAVEARAVSRVLERKLSIRELAEAWGWSYDRIYRLVHHPDRTKRIPHLRLGDSIFFSLSELEGWLETRAERPAAPPPAPKPREPLRNNRYRD